MGLQTTLRALADPIGREILKLLKNGRISAGDIAVRYDETSFTIEATYWNDRSVSYADIEALAYLPRDDAGLRGSTLVLSGRDEAATQAIYEELLARKGTL